MAEPASSGAGRAGGRDARGGMLVNGVRIWPSPGRRRAPPPMASVRVGAAVPPMYELLKNAFAPWRTQLVEQWPQIVGPKFAARLRPGRMEGYDKRTLSVFAQNSLWLSEASRELRDLLARIKKAVPDAPINRVIFNLDPGEPPPPDDHPRAPR